eukprot:scaffold6446_cov104-Isochrysis_galbana.AAC.4
MSGLRVNVKGRSPPWTRWAYGTTGTLRPLAGPGPSISPGAHLIQGHDTEVPDVRHIERALLDQVEQTPGSAKHQSRRLLS